MKHFRLTFLIVFALAMQSLTVKSTNVVDVIVNSEEHTILETALIEADLVDDFLGTGPFTVFAPTDDAFNALPEGVLEALLADEFALTDFLLYHVLPGTVLSTDLSDGMTVEMYNGDMVEISVTGAGVFINNAKVTTADIETDNGVVHVLDVVLVPSPDVQLKETAEYGQILTDTYGNTLYYFTKDAEGNSMCVDGCVTNWPVFYSETPELGEGLEETDFGTIERPDGAMQTTYKGWPLYYFVNDTIPGQINGEGLIGKWFVAKPDYTIMMIDDQLTGNDGVDYQSDYTTGEEITQYFVDEEGNTFYTWVNDNFGINNFTDADFTKNSIWPVYEEENIVVPSVLNPADFDVIDVYGKKQMTFKGWPLYYFGQDMMMRGSNKGVSVPSPGVWPVAVQDLETAPVIETVVDIATSDDNFSILVSALTRDDLTIDFVGALTGEGPFTVFAPTNAAFAALLDELGAASLADIDSATLEAVLQMHVVSGKVMSTDLTEGMTAPTLLGEEIMFSLDGGATITDPNGRVSNITAVDIEAQNGVVHVIDTVILPDLRPETVVDIATSDDNFSILVSALTRDDLTIDFVGALTGEGPFTVFAPTNAAFAALLDELGAASLADIDSATLEAVLQMHVVSGKVMSTDLTEGMTAPTLLGEEIMFSLDGGATITDPNGRVSNITAVDIEAQNGVVHVIDTVILPDLRPETVVDIATSDDNFSILVSALTRDDLTIDFVGALTGEGPFTVFAPTNAAFAALLDELGATSLADIDSATLEAVLQMHVVSGKVMSADLTEGMTAPTLLGEEIMFSLDGGATITDPNGRVSNITAVDIEAQNGVVHVIDTVILPDLRPETVVDIATSDDNFSILVSALTRDDLTIDFVGALTGEGPFTVFAPTNAAFAALLDELGAASLADIDSATLEAVLQMHVVSGKVMSTDLTEGMTAPTLLGEEIMFSLDGGATITDPNGRVSNITAVDIEAQNGVVHVIDVVILPEQTATNIEDFGEMTMSFYPNPAVDRITVESDEIGGTLRLIDISGKLLLEKQIRQYSESVDLNGVKSGVYFISLQNGSAAVTKKLIVR